MATATASSSRFSSFPWVKPWNLTSWTSKSRQGNSRKIAKEFDILKAENPINSNIKLVQNLAYKTKDERQTAIPFKVLRTLSTNITKLSNDKLARLLYACSRGSFEEPALLDLIVDEVLHRLTSISAYDLLRLIQSLSNIYLFGKCKGELLKKDFIKILAKQLLKDLQNVNCVNLAHFVSILHALDILDEEMARKLNFSLRIKLKYASNPDFFILPVLSLAFANKISLSNVSLALKQSNRLASHLLTYNTTDFASNALTDDIVKVNKYLLPLKLLDYILRFDMPDLYNSLEPPAKSFLTTVESRLLKLDYSYGDPGFISFALRKAINRSEHDLISHVQGPYILDLCDPVERIALEWDKPWMIGNRREDWNTLFLSKWTETRRRHLRLLGYRVVTIDSTIDGSIIEAEVLKSITQCNTPTCTHRD